MIVSQLHLEEHSEMKLTYGTSQECTAVTDKQMLLKTAQKKGNELDLLALTLRKLALECPSF